MPGETVNVAGKIDAIFGHRFVLATATGKVLADLGPKGEHQVALNVGDDVELTGEPKPSEVKVHAISIGGRRVKLKPHKHEEDADENLALAAIKAAGFEPISALDRKPKHFEVLGRRGSSYVEFHIELDGEIRRQKPFKPLKSRP